MSSITIKDVAARAGVGKATASRALNGLKHVSPEARARVQQAAEELSFAPDPTSRRLASRRGRAMGGGMGLLAYLGDALNWVPEPERKRIQAHAGTMGYRMEFCKTGPSAMERDLRELWARGAEGLLVRGGQGAFPVLREPWRTRYATVLIGNHPLYECPKIACDFPKGLLVAAENLAAMGRRKIGLWLINDGVNTPHLNAVGMALALKQKFRKSKNLRLCLHTSVSADIGEGNFIRWLEKERPDAFLVPTHESALQLIRSGLVDPGKTALVSQFNGPNLVDPRIGTLGFSMEILHEEGLKLLVDQIRRETPASPRPGGITLIQPLWHPPIPEFGAKIHRRSTAVRSRVPSVLS